jgi:hypothetical protein
LEAYPALSKSIKGLYFMPIRVKPLAFNFYTVVLVSPSKRTRGVDMALGDIWFSIYL